METFRRQGGPVSAFPPSPWRLGGWGIATLGLLDARAVAHFVPHGARLLTLARAKTVGGVVFLSYEYGSLTYRELCVVAGIVRIGMRIALLIPRLYVDSAASLAGGRTIWGVPKELARFSIDTDAEMTSIDVRQGLARVCRIRCSTPRRRLRLPFNVPAFGVRNDAFLFFTGRLRANVAWARAEVEIPPDAEIAGLGLERPLAAFRCDDLTLVVPTPRAVARPVLLPAASYGVASTFHGSEYARPG